MPKEVSSGVLYHRAGERLDDVRLALKKAAEICSVPVTAGGYARYKAHKDAASVLRLAATDYRRACDNYALARYGARGLAVYGALGRWYQFRVYAPDGLERFMRGYNEAMASDVGMEMTVENSREFIRMILLGSELLREWCRVKMVGG